MITVEKCKCVEYNFLVNPNILYRYYLHKSMFIFYKFILKTFFPLINDNYLKIFIYFKLYFLNYMCDVCLTINHVSMSVSKKYLRISVKDLTGLRGVSRTPWGFFSPWRKNGWMADPSINVLVKIGISRCLRSSVNLRETAICA